MWWGLESIAGAPGVEWGTREKKEVAKSGNRGKKVTKGNRGRASSPTFFVFDDRNQEQKKNFGGGPPGTKGTFFGWRESRC